MEVVGLFGTFLEVLVQTVGEGDGSAFGSFRVVGKEFLFQFSFVAADFRGLQVVVEETDRFSVYVDVALETTVVGGGVGDELFIFDGVAAEYCQLQKAFSCG